MSHRLFFALWPPSELQLAIEDETRELVARCGGKPIPRINYHATLAFLGSVAHERLPMAHSAAGEIEAASFDIRLDHVHGWRRSGICYLGAHMVPPALSRVAETLHRELCEHEFILQEHPFRLHVTLARDARVTQRVSVQPLQWHVDDFVLVESTPRRGGSQYEIIGRWALE